MGDVTSLPLALRECKMIPLKQGTKVPAVAHATFEAAGRWDEGVDAFLAAGNRVGVMMGSDYIGLDADLKMSYQDADDGSGAQVVVTRNGLDDIQWILDNAGLSSLPKTLMIKTQGGGRHFVYKQNPQCRVTQRSIGCLDIRAARNSYLAIGQGYEVLDDGDGQLTELPVEIARAIMAAPATQVAGKDAMGERESNGTVVSMETGFNNALISIKGSMVRAGWSEEQATEAIRKLNEVSDDPMDWERFETTVARPKGYEQGSFIEEDLVEWARRQVGLSEDDPDNRFLDKFTVQRLWTAKRYKQFQELQALEPPEMERFIDVVNEPPPNWVMEGLITEGLYGLAGPPEAGKSLLVRDLLNCVANGISWQNFRVQRPRGVSYVISEGHFDLAERFGSMQTQKISIFRQPVMLNNDSAVDYFIKQHEGIDTGLVVFDIIYHMGLGDDNLAGDVKMILGSCRRISFALNTAVLVVGHPGLNNWGRRFRGSSAWRSLFDGELHMSDGRLTCEKHKYARKETMEWEYDIEWPELSYLGMNAIIARENRNVIVWNTVQENPNESQRSIAARLAPDLGISEERIRQIIRQAPRRQILSFVTFTFVLFLSLLQDQ